METKYKDDSDQYHDSNINFLQSLSVEELLAMQEDESEFENEFCLEGEVRESDFDADEFNSYDNDDLYLEQDL
jgi:hypothetical protein